MATNPWILAVRPKTLVAGASPVLLGTALAWRDGHLEPLAALLCLLFAIFCQIGANWINDLADFEKGADHAGRIGPARMVAQGRISPKAMQMAVMGIFTAAFVVGLGLIPFGGIKLLWIGFASILTAILYSCGPKPLAWIGLGDVVDLIFFGLIATAGTYYVQAHSVPAYVVLVALGIGAMINTILLVNNTRDIESDRLVGKKTLPVRFGPTAAFFFYRISGLFALAIGPILWGRHGFGWPVLSVLVLYPFIWQVQQGMLKAHSAEAWNFIFTRTAQLVLAYTFILTGGIVAGVLFK